jgi:hypothetical protein
MLPSLLKSHGERPNLFAGLDKILYQLFDTAASVGGFFMSMDIA